MRRLVVVVVWLVAVATVVIAIGVRVRAKRLADPRQTLAVYLTEVPPEIATIASVLGRDRGSIQVEIRANQQWVRTLAKHNGFIPIDGALAGLAADRWILTDGRKKGAVVHLLLPLNGQPALLTIMP